MSKEIPAKQLEAVIKLPAPKRYDHFVKVVADWQEAWGLYSDGWALAETSNGERVFPLWPARAYAELCAVGDWDGYEPSPIPLEDLMNELLPNLKEDGVQAGVFFVPDVGSVTVEIDLVLEDLRNELRKYE